MSQTQAQLVGNVRTGAVFAGVVTTTSINVADVVGINSDGINVTGVVTATSINVTGNVSIAGTLTYDDVTNVDSIGLVTARTGIQVLAGGLTVVGVSTLGVTTTTDLTTQNLYVSGLSTFIGVATHTGTIFGNNLSLTGIATVTGYFDGRVPNIPQNAQGGAYTLVKSDAGKHINAGGNVTVNASIFDIGDAISVFNDTGGDITIIQGSSVTLRLVADTSTGTRTLANYGLACILCVGSNEFVVSGGGVS